MDSAQFDRWTKLFGRNMSRRSLGVLAVGGASALISRRRVAAQTGPSTCGSSGDVCTMLLGCCDGLTCVTSAINTNYGVCAPGGDGGTTVGGTSLISPFSDGIDQEIASLSSDATSTSTTTTDPQAERAAKLQEKRNRKDTRRTRIKTRRDDQQETQQDRRDDARLAEGPLIDAILINEGGLGGTTETLQIRNRESSSIFVSQISSLLRPTVSGSLRRTIPAGGRFSFYSDAEASHKNINDEDEFAWNQAAICSTEAGAGFRVTVAFNSNSTNLTYDFRCDSTGSTFDQVSTLSNSRKRKKKNDQRAKARQRKKSKSRSSKGKGR